MTLFISRTIWSFKCLCLINLMDGQNKGELNKPLEKFTSFFLSFSMRRMQSDFLFLIYLRVGKILFVCRLNLATFLLQTWTTRLAPHQTITRDSDTQSANIASALENRCSTLINKILTTLGKISEYHYQWCHNEFFSAN